MLNENFVIISGNTALSRGTVQDLDTSENLSSLIMDKTGSDQSQRPG